MSSQPASRISVALVCASNQNRSMEAHALLQRRGYNVRSFGTGSHCKLPGPFLDRPNVFEFSTPYSEMFRQLKLQNQALYTENGVLSMLERNSRVKKCPERWQECPDMFRVIITFEQRVFDAVIEDMQGRGSTTGDIAHIFNVPVKDTHEEATIGATVALQLLQMKPDWENELDTLLDEFQRKMQKQVLHDIVFY